MVKNYFVHFDICHRMASLQKIVLHNLDLNLQGQTFEAAILPSKLRKMQTLLLPSDRKSGICHRMAPLDRKSGICHRMAPLRMLYIMILIYIFKVMNLKMWISRKCWELAKMLKSDFYRGWYLPSNETISNIVLNDFVLNFHGQTLQVAILTGKH